MSRTAVEKKPTLRKQPADSAPYGTSITRNGRHVWAAYDGETLVAVAATADEVRGEYGRAYRRWWAAQNYDHGPGERRG
jgi:hypothetical protein